jgi:drug/metabolite transporter (DMT)-like permease
VNPVVAVFLGWLMLGEVIGKNQILALCIILAGVVLVSLPKKGKGEHLKASRRQKTYLNADS